MSVCIENKPDDQCYACYCSPEESDFYRCDGCGVLICQDCLPEQDEEAPAEFCEECIAKSGDTTE